MAGLLALVTIALYWPATRFDFINYDDQAYVTENPHVQAGLTWEGLAWAFGRLHGEQTYWHPLSWVSHMVDCQLYGLKPGGHHLTSVLLHAVNAVLVLLVFTRMTGVFWRCVMLAVLFAVHPLQVDSVAWVAERKTLLSASFWLLSTWAYVRYAQGGPQRSAVGGQNAESRNPLPSALFYLLSLGLFALGLMCKPVLVTLPLVLLLLDYWPLRRFELSPEHVSLKAALPLVREKIPFLVLGVASSVITLLAHRALGMLDSASRLPWDMRLENALVSYVRYLGKTLWPSRLAVVYPYPAAWPSWEVLTCGLLLVVISSLVLGTGRRRPWLVVGWFWFLGVLVPFIGLVQAGAQAMADRFMYAPVIGLLAAAIWGLHGLARGGRCQQVALSAAGLAMIVLCLALTQQQLGYWKDSEALFEHTLEVTKNNAVAQNCLGNALAGTGRVDEAISHYQEALRLKPDYAVAHNNLGIALGAKGRIDEAISQFRETIRLNPDHANAHYNLGVAFDKEGQIDEAIRQFHEAVRLKPDHANAHYNLGLDLDRRGRIDEAVSQYEEVIRLNPDDAEAHNRLGIVLGEKGLIDDAIAQFQEALRIKPGYATARNNLARAVEIKNAPAGP